MDHYTVTLQKFSVLKSLSATFLVLLYILAMLRPVIPLFEYVINQDYIAEFLCINTDRPELSCNGKCYLMQKIAEQNEEKRQNLPRIAMEEYPIGFVTISSFDTYEALANKTFNLLGYHNDYSFLYCDSSFHPPTHTS